MVDTFVWQALASVIIPGFTINRVCAASLYLLGRTTKWPLPVRKWTTTAIGLSTIPFIITPIDRLTEEYACGLCKLAIMFDLIVRARLLKHDEQFQLHLLLGGAKSWC